jgi:hypothetical protein
MGPYREQQTHQRFTATQTHERVRVLLFGSLVFGSNPAHAKIDIALGTVLLCAGASVRAAAGTEAVFEAGIPR